LTSFLLAAGAWFSPGSVPGVPELWEFRLTLGVMAGLALLSLMSLRTLDADAGRSLRALSAS
jgi:hypothetical protein